jgi:hypothetical protein
MTCEQSHNNNYENTDINHNAMIWINDRPSLLSPSYLTKQNERTISSSSSEQLIPKEKKTGKVKKTKSPRILDYVFIFRNVFSCIW